MASMASEVESVVIWIQIHWVILKMNNDFEKWIFDPQKWHISADNFRGREGRPNNLNTIETFRLTIKH